MENQNVTLAALASGLATAITVILAARAFLRSRALAAAENAETEAEEVMAQGSHSRFGGLAKMMRPATLNEISELRRRLGRAGLRNQDAVDLFSVGRALTTLVGVALFLLILIGSGGSPFGMIFGAALLGGFFLAPTGWLSLRTKTRQEKLAGSLPPTLDLLVTCMEAGLGLEQALARVASEIGYSDPEMAEELSVVVAEMRAGLSTGESFRKLADRVTVEEVHNMSNVIIQSASLGAAIGRTLREYAASARRRRELTLEEAAGKVTAGLTLPLTLCLLPSAVLAMLGPAVVIVYRTMFE